MLSLKIFGPDGLKNFTLHLNEKITVGRAKECKLRLKDTDVSSVHCEITLNEDHVLLKDLNSTNGTFVNNDKVSERKIFLSDQVRIGLNSIEIEQDELSAEEMDQYRFKGLDIKNGLEISVEGNKTLKKRLTAYSNKVSGGQRRSHRKDIKVTKSENEFSTRQRQIIAMVVIVIQLIFLFSRDIATLEKIPILNYIVLAAAMLLEYKLIIHFLGRSSIKKVLK